MNIVHAMLGLGILMTAIGGMLDLMDQKRLLGFSKEHFWNDGIFIVLVAGVVAIITKRS